ncbi:M20/M25/M40 family metallo-hydrolase [Clostridium sporogenes]|uniref:M20/M25/M40 family metallo-hydrolase n=1 Tax=Clostridium sporogenes TaxID=1509 RepID=UPI0006B25FAD|nr:M20/M25/M40 family metallo-hydrolase [Clostridium sporogenes]KOY66622.1 hypothetical protein AN649_06495 [Clostridium sporogenes]
MKKIFSFLVVVGIIIFSMIVCYNQLTPPKVKTINGQIMDDNLNTAIKNLQVIAKEPHFVGTSQDAKVREFLVSYLKNLGAQVEVEKGTGVGHNKKTYEIYNVIAKFEGTDKDGLNILLDAHYDSGGLLCKDPNAIPESPGAADDGAGVVAMLEAGKYIKEKGPLRNNVYMVFTDGEEAGLLGAQLLADKKRDFLKNIDFLFAFEARGNSGPFTLIETSDNNLGMVKEFVKATSYPLSYSFAQDIYKKSPSASDNTIYKKNNVPGMLCASFGGTENYHSKRDNVENIDKGMLKHFILTSLEVTKHFGNMTRNDFEKIDKKSDSINFPFIKGNMIVYSTKFVVPLASIAIILLIVIYGLSLKKNIVNVKNMFKGFVFNIIAIAIPVLVTIPIVNYIIKLKKLFAGGFTVFYFVGADYYGIPLLIVMSIIACIIIMYFLSNKINKIDMIFSSLIIWGILGIATSVLLKGLSYYFIIPLILYILAIVYIILRGEKRISLLETLVLYCIVVFISLLIVIPVIYTIYKAMTFGALAVDVALIVLYLICFVPSTLYVLENSHIGKYIEV